jgi:hypothetical protein
MRYLEKLVRAPMSLLITFSSLANAVASSLVLFLLAAMSDACNFATDSALFPSVDGGGEAVIALVAGVDEPEWMEDEDEASESFSLNPLTFGLEPLRVAEMT